MKFPDSYPRSRHVCLGLIGRCCFCRRRFSDTSYVIPCYYAATHGHGGSGRGGGLGCWDLQELSQFVTAEKLEREEKKGNHVRLRPLEKSLGREEQ